jgi:hypothetical protein
MYDNSRYSDRSPPERPRSEPEILPPDRSGGSNPSHIWLDFDQQGRTRRIYMGRPGPFSIFAALLIAGIIIAGIVLLLVGVVLFWIPVIVIAVGAAILAGTVRYYWYRLRGRMRGGR